jgi:putative Ca2+/H+ antiporter (TMEM165/GDT1 family)
MILFSEVGDKTFLVAALMAMKHDRMVVFSAAFGALITMTVLSAVLGHTVPTLIPKRMTSFLAAGLFFVFGARLLREGLAMDPNEGVGAEMHEVELELEQKEKQGRRRGNSVSPYALEMGLGGGHTRKSRSKSRFPTPPRSPSTSPDGRSPSPASRGARGALVGFFGGLNNLLSLLLSPAWVQTFVMTFLGEWGDRSQIATIAMAAGQDYWWVTLGAVVGHGCCTGVAVIGGKAIAGRVSMKVGKSSKNQFLILVFPWAWRSVLISSTYSNCRWCGCLLSIRRYLLSRGRLLVGDRERTPFLSLPTAHAILLYVSYPLSKLSCCTRFSNGMYLISFFRLSTHTYSISIRKPLRPLGSQQEAVGRLAVSCAVF